MKMFKKNFLLLILLVIHLFLLFNLKFTAWPEMLLWPYLITKGWLPYANIAIAHTPLLVLKLAIFYKIFGTGIIQLKIFTWLLILFMDLLVYFAVNKFWNRKIALYSLISFIILQLFYEGNGLWFDLYMGIFAFISFLFARNKNWLWTGIFWGLAFISKQTAVWFLIPIALEVLRFKKMRINNIGKIILGSFFVGALFIVVLFAFGIFKDFWYWAVNFGIFILPKSQGQIQLPDLKNLIVSLFPYSIFIPILLNKKTRDINLFIWAIAGGFGAYPRFEYFHFQPAIPFLAIAAGVVVTNFRNLEKYLRIFMIFYFFGSLYLFSGYLLRDFGEGTRFYEQDVQDIASYVKRNTNTNDKVFVMNWWDNVYALTGTLPAINPWVPQLSWYQELSGVQEQEVFGIIDSKPKMILVNPYTEAGLSAYIPQRVYNYVLDNYKLKEKVDGIEIFVPKK